MGLLRKKGGKKICHPLLWGGALAPPLPSPSSYASDRSLNFSLVCTTACDLVLVSCCLQGVCLQLTPQSGVFKVIAIFSHSLSVIWTQWVTSVFDFDIR